jgi:hypothetical protein
MHCSVVATKQRKQAQANKQKGDNHMSTVSPHLRNLLLTHWKTYHPTMYRELVQESKLEAHLNAIAEQWCDLMYDLVTVKRMDYAAAREIAVSQFLLPEEDGLDSTSQNQPDFRETSE